VPVVQRGGEVHVPGSAELPLRPAAPEAAGRPTVPGLRAQGPGEQLRPQAQGEAARQGREMSFRIGSSALLWGLVSVAASSSAG
jgi:hypothetical protein